jgi:hypothetical protein
MPWRVSESPTTDFAADAFFHIVWFEFACDGLPGGFLELFRLGRNVYSLKSEIPVVVTQALCV